MHGPIQSGETQLAVVIPRGYFAIIDVAEIGSILGLFDPLHFTRKEMMIFLCENEVESVLFQVSIRAHESHRGCAIGDIAVERNRALR